MATLTNVLDTMYWYQLIEVYFNGKKVFFGPKREFLNVPYWWNKLRNYPVQDTVDEGNTTSIWIGSV